MFKNQFEKKVLNVRLCMGNFSICKQHLGCSTAELVYGTTLRIPGEFFAPGTDPLTSDPSTYAAQLKLAGYAVFEGNSTACRFEPHIFCSKGSVDMSICVCSA